MSEELVTIFKNKGVAVVATDTLYGVVGSALHPEVVDRIYEIKGRTQTKPFIVLIASLEMLAQFGVVLTQQDIEILHTIWPNAVTVLLPVSDTYSYIHRGTREIAFRMPAKESLQKLIQEVGPLVAPSANPEGKEPAHTSAEAREYFGTTVDWYEDGGYVEGAASTIIRIRDGKITDIIRQGSVIV